MVCLTISVKRNTALSAVLWSGHVVGHSEANLSVMETISHAGSGGSPKRFLRIYSNPWPPSFNELNCIVPLADNACSGLFFGRRVKERQIDFRLLKKWVRLCLRWHDEDCERLIFESEEAAVLPYFKVIDVQRQCVVDTPLESRYIFLATKASILELQKPGSLALLSEKNTYDYQRCYTPSSKAWGALSLGR